MYHIINRGNYRRWIFDAASTRTAFEACLFETCERSGWGNPQVPCLHADPILPDCLPGETVRVRGRLWFYEGDDPDQELARMKDGPFEVRLRKVQ